MPTLAELKKIEDDKIFLAQLREQLSQRWRGQISEKESAAKAAFRQHFIAHDFTVEVGAKGQLATYRELRYLLQPVDLIGAHFILTTPDKEFRILIGAAGGASNFDQYTLNKSLDEQIAAANLELSAPAPILGYTVNSKVRTDFSQLHATEFSEVLDTLCA